MALRVAPTRARVKGGGGCKENAFEKTLPVDLFDPGTGKKARFPLSTHLARPPRSIIPAFSRQTDPDQHLENSRSRTPDPDPDPENTRLNPLSALPFPVQWRVVISPCSCIGVWGATGATVHTTRLSKWGFGNSTDPTFNGRGFEGLQHKRDTK